MEERRSGDDKARSEKRQEEGMFMYEDLQGWVYILCLTKKLGGGLSRETEEV